MPAMWAGGAASAPVDASSAALMQCSNFRAENVRVVDVIIVLPQDPTRRCGDPGP